MYMILCPVHHVNPVRKKWITSHTTKVIIPGGMTGENNLLVCE